MITRRALLQTAIALAGALVAAPMPIPAQAPVSEPANVATNADVLAAQRLFSAWMDGQIAYRGLPGVVVGVVSDQQLVWAA